MTKKRSQGRSGEVELTDDAIDRLAREAEDGYDVEQLRPRGRPRMGSAPAAVFHVRLEPELRDALDAWADERGVTPSDVVRRAIRAYLGARNRKSQ